MDVSTAKTHPWQSGPAELISYALKHLRKDDDFSHRIAFLLFDIGVETLFKTFLTLPADITHAETPYHERRKAANGSFHDLVLGVEAAGSSRLSVHALSHVEFYHNLRNQLYHHGNGITVSVENVLDYAKEAVHLLKTLLGVDLTDDIALAPDALEELSRQTDELESALNRLRRAVELTIEKLEPKLLLPSVVNDLRDLSVGVDIGTFEDKLDTFVRTMETCISDNEIREWVLNLTDRYVSGASSQAIANARFLFEMMEDPISFYLLIIGGFVLPEGNIEKEFLWNGEDLAIIDDPEYHIVGLYSSAKILRLWASPGHYHSGTSTIANIVEHGKKEIQLIDKLTESLSNWIKQN